MTTLFFIILCVAVFHFVYEGIILPSVRLCLRYKLFALRDRVRWLTIAEGEKNDGAFLEYLQNAINNSINLLHIFDLRTFYLAFSAFRKNPELYKKVSEISDFINSHSTQETKAIVRKNHMIFTFALLANSGVMFIYACILIVPFLALLICYKTIKTVIKGILSTPENQVERLVSSYNIAVVT